MGPHPYFPHSIHSKKSGNGVIPCPVERSFTRRETSQTRLRPMDKRSIRTLVSDPNLSPHPGSDVRETSGLKTLTTQISMSVSSPKSLVPQVQEVKTPPFFSLTSLLSSEQILGARRTYTTTLT